MAPRDFVPFALCLPLLAGCPDDTPRPGLQDIPPADTTDLDVPGTDAPVGPDTGTPVVPDAAMDAPGDTTVAADTGTILDVPPMEIPDVAPRSPFCGFAPGVMNSLAIRIAGCTGVPAQQLLTEFYRLEYWEAAGPFAMRPCDALRCAATAITCGEVRNDCLKYIVSPAPDGGTCAGPMPECVRTLASRCEGARVVRDDCGARDQRCIATATEVTCAPMTSPSCAPGAAARCDRETLERCVAGVYVPVARCGFTASRCDATADACVGTGAACTGAATACEGTYLRACRGGRAQLLDCGQLVMGATCQATGGSAYCGVATECDPVATATSTPGGRCEGNTLIVCGGGRAVRFNCATEGFRGCGTSGCVE